VIYLRNDIYTMPTVMFVAGQSNTLNWRLYTRGGSPYNAKGCTGNFSVVDYSDQTGDPLISKTVGFKIGIEEVMNVASVDLAPGDTLQLDGKYIYQLTIKDTYGEAEIPNQGFLLITHNINKGFLQ